MLSSTSQIILFIFDGLIVEISKEFLSGYFLFIELTKNVYKLNSAEFIFWYFIKKYCVEKIKKQIKKPILIGDFLVILICAFFSVKTWKTDFDISMKIIANVIFKNVF